MLLDLEEGRVPADDTVPASIGNLEEISIPQVPAARTAGQRDSGGKSPKNGQLRANYTIIHRPHAGKLTDNYASTGTPP